MDFMRQLFAVLSKVMVIGWFNMLIVLYFRALFHPKYALVAWVITLLFAMIILYAPPQKCHICLDGGYIDGK
jgi:hypothetical protein